MAIECNQGKGAKGMAKGHITDFVFDNANKFGDKVVIACEDKKITARQLALFVEGTAASLRTILGDSKDQQIVGIYLQNSWQFVVTYLAILHTGNIAMPIDTKYKQQQTDAIINQIEPSIIISSKEYLEVLDDKCPVIEWDAVIKSQDKNEAIGDYLRLNPKEQIASLLFTSGTTGNPKTVPYTHDSYIWNIETASKLWGWTDKDILLLSLPLSHWHGLAMVFTGSIIMGNELRIHDGFNQEKIINELTGGEVTIFSHVPAGYAQLAEYAKGKSIVLTTKKPLCLSASSALPPHVWRKFKESLGIEINERYGTSEGGLIASNIPGDHQNGTVGRLVPGVEIKFNDIGAIAVRSPGVFPGYYNHTIKPENGWWFTGDIGYMGDDNRLYIKGRVQEKIKKLGYTVYPRDIEWSLSQVSGIKESFVLGIQDNDSISDRIIYFIVGDVKESEVFEYATKNMHTSWRPDSIVKLDSIPKNPNGKTDLKALRQLAESIGRKDIIKASSINTLLEYGGR